MAERISSDGTSGGTASEGAFTNQGRADRVGGAGVPLGGDAADATEDAARAIMRERDYWQSPEKQARVAGIFKKLYSADATDAAGAGRPEGATEAAGGTDGAPPPIDAGNGLMVLFEEPAADFEPEAGKKYFVLEKDGTAQAAAAFAEKLGASQDQYRRALATYARNVVSTASMTAEQLATDRVATWREFGGGDVAAGRQRAQAMWSRLVAAVGEDLAREIENALDGARDMAELEKLMSGNGGGNDGGGNLVDLKEDERIRALMGDTDYSWNPRKQAEVAAYFKRLYPGTIETAVLDRRRPG